MNVPLMMFWALIALIAVCVTLAGHFGRMETEKTIRMAIEKGAVLDAESLRQLKLDSALPWGLRLVVTGIVVGFLGLGVALFGATLAVNEPESVAPLLGIGGLLVFLGLGLGLAGTWLSRALKASA